MHNITETACNYLTIFRQLAVVLYERPGQQASVVVNYSSRGQLVQSLFLVDIKVSAQNSTKFAFKNSLLSSMRRRNR